MRLLAVVAAVSFLALGVRQSGAPDKKDVNKMLRSRPAIPSRSAP